MQSLKKAWVSFKNYCSKNRDIIIVIFSIVITLGLIIKAFSLPAEIDILANLKQTKGSINKDSTDLKGVILKDGKPVQNALVWLIIKGQKDSEVIPSKPTEKTDSTGMFIFSNLPKYLSSDITGVKDNKDSIANIKTDANLKNKGVADSNVERANQNILAKEGETLSKENIKSFIIKASINDEVIERVLSVNSAGGLSAEKSIKVEHWRIDYLPMIFLLSILFPFIIKSFWVKYVYSISAAFLFSGGMILTIAIWVSNVSTFNQNDILSLGFVHFFTNSGEWVLSLTSSSTPIKDGFWVPIWVMLLSVIGSSLYTVLIILSQITKRPNWDILMPKTDSDPVKKKDYVKEIKKFNKVLENIVRHQFYIVFAPIGSIFVYQLLVLGNASTNQTTVAIAALASGLLLNSILDKALALTENLIKPEKENKDEEEEEK